MLNNIFRLALLVFISIPSSVSGEALDFNFYKDNWVTIRYEKSLQVDAKDVAAMYQSVKRELERKLNRKIGFQPNIFILSASSFQKLVQGNNLITAFADPVNNTMVIDHSKVLGTPLDLKLTIKHELCHLLLHDYIQKDNLPKWLNEGVSQWVSEGMADIINFDRDKVLKNAVLFKGILPLKDISAHFPRSPDLFKLSYEQSRSVVEYIDDTFGTDKLLDILNELQKGQGIAGAVHTSLGIKINELENAWHRHIQRKYTWFRYVSDNIYWLIFFAGAVITILGYLHLRMRMKKYADEEQEEGDQP